MGKAKSKVRTNAEEPLRLGVLGGTFDPIHIGHLRLAIEAIERFHLNRVELVLASVPPHKESSLVTTWEKRWRMLELACADHEKLMPSSLELDRPGPSYTVDTLRQIRSGLDGRHELFLLVGMDAAQEMRTWKSYRRIPELARIVVAQRPGVEESEEALAELGDWVEPLEIPTLDISSTRIRTLVRQGREIAHLVPDRVRTFIREQGLYLNEPSSYSKTNSCSEDGEEPL